jgi:hypothetical protein
MENYKSQSTKWGTYSRTAYYLESSVDDVKTVLCGKKLGHAAQAHNVRMLQSKPHHQLFKQVLRILKSMLSTKT